MHIDDIVEYTDWCGDKHDAKVTKVMEQPTNIEETQHTELINVEYQVKGRVRIAELVSKKPNAGGECYGKVIKESETAEEDAKEEAVEAPQEAPTEAQEEPAENTAGDSGDDSGNESKPE